MNFRKVTDLESLTSLPDGAMVLVIDSGEAKQIPAVKVGGGSTTILYGVIGGGSGTSTSLTTTTSYSAMYMDAARTVAATAQGIYDAVMGGCHWISVADNGEEYLVAIASFSWESYDDAGTYSQGDPTNVKYVFLTDRNNVTYELDEGEVHPK